MIELISRLSAFWQGFRPGGGAPRVARQPEFWPERPRSRNDALGSWESAPLECEKCCLSCPPIFMVEPEVFPAQAVKSDGCCRGSLLWPRSPSVGRLHGAWAGLSPDLLCPGCATPGFYGITRGRDCREAFGMGATAL